MPDETQEGLAARIGQHVGRWLVEVARGDADLAPAAEWTGLMDEIDRLTRERDEARAELDRRKRVPLEQAMALAADRLARFEALAREAKTIGTNDRSPRADGLRHNLTDRLAALAGPEGA